MRSGSNSRAIETCCSEAYRDALNRGNELLRQYEAATGEALPSHIENVAPPGRTGKRTSVAHSGSVEGTRNRQRGDREDPELRLSAIRVRAFAGPSFFRVQQDTINEIIYNQLSNGVGGNSEPGGNRVDRLRTPHARVACEADEVLLEIVRVIRQRGILDAQLHTCSARDANRTIQEVLRSLSSAGSTNKRRNSRQETTSSPLSFRYGTSPRHSRETS